MNEQNVTYEEIIYEVDGPVATITMNRPNTLNALTSLTQAEIRHALDASERNGDVVGTVLTGAGRGFCSGVDMKALGNMSEAGQRVGQSYEHLAADPGNPDNDANFKSSPTYFLGLRKPLIAAVNGACAGLGFSTQRFVTCVSWTQTHAS
jgi:enoyl-CoA hydratase/carnithine racemase